MRQKGMRISAEEIYSVNHGSMKDAVFSFGGYCTAAVVSHQGLVLTNLHCSGSVVSALSSPERDIRKNGFWARNTSQELPVEGLSLSRVVRIESVTGKVLEGIQPQAKAGERDAKIQKNIASIIEAATANTHWGARVEPFFYGEEYYLFVTETFTDIRLVGIPAENIGKFGGESDNWTWPRFAADFAFFRIYAGPDGAPAAYHPANKPLDPGYAFPISQQGYQQGDFTMVYGFPGQTSNFLSSFAVKELQEQTLTDKIKITGQMVTEVQDALHHNPVAASRMGWVIANMQNHLKKWQEEQNGLKRMGVVGTKAREEGEFQDWANADPNRKVEYGYLLRKIEQIHQKRVYLNRFSNYLDEGIFRNGLLRLAFEFQDVGSLDLSPTADPWNTGQKVEHLRRMVRDYFRNFDPKADQKLLEAAILQFLRDIPPAMQPSIFQGPKMGPDPEKVSDFCERIYRKSILSSEWKVQKFLEEFSPRHQKRLQKDPAYQLMLSIVEFNDARIKPRLHRFDDELHELNRQYLAGRRAQFPARKFYPDANATLRLSYGQISPVEGDPLQPAKWQTTLSQLVGRHQPGSAEFDAGERLLALQKEGNYGPFGENGDLPVCFIASNHTSSGSSGSPVINASGQLIGLNFDRNREGTVSDILFDPKTARNISVDIRYVLFLTEKYANASHLLKELDIVQ